MSELGPDFLEGLDTALCARDIGRAISGMHVVLAECPLRKGGYPEASKKILEDETVQLQCVTNPDCPYAPVLLIEDCIVTLADNSL